MTGCVAAPLGFLDNITSIESDSAGFDGDWIPRDRLSHDAIERCPERICAADTRLDDQAEKLLPGCPWQIAAARQHFRHPCDRIGFSVVRTVVSVDLTVLKADAKRALDRLGDPGHTAADIRPTPAHQQPPAGRNPP